MKRFLASIGIALLLVLLLGGIWSAANWHTIHPINPDPMIYDKYQYVGYYTIPPADACTYFSRGEPSDPSIHIWKEMPQEGLDYDTDITCIWQGGKITKSVTVHPQHVIPTPTAIPPLSGNNVSSLIRVDIGKYDWVGWTDVIPDPHAGEPCNLGQMPQTANLYFWEMKFATISKSSNSITWQEFPDSTYSNEPTHSKEKVKLRFITSDYENTGVWKSTEIRLCQEGLQVSVPKTLDTVPTVEGEAFDLIPLGIICPGGRRFALFKITGEQNPESAECDSKNDSAIFHYYKESLTVHISPTEELIVNGKTVYNCRSDDKWDFQTCQGWWGDSWLYSRPRDFKGGKLPLEIHVDYRGHSWSAGYFRALDFPTDFPEAMVPDIFRPLPTFTNESYHGSTKPINGMHVKFDVTDITDNKGNTLVELQYVVGEDVKYYLPVFTNGCYWSWDIHGNIQGRRKFVLEKGLLQTRDCEYDPK